MSRQIFNLPIIDNTITSGSRNRNSYQAQYLSAFNVGNNEKTGKLTKIA